MMFGQRHAHRFLSANPSLPVQPKISVISGRCLEGLGVETLASWKDRVFDHRMDADNQMGSQGFAEGFVPGLAGVETIHEMTEQERLSPQHPAPTHPERCLVHRFRRTGRERNLGNHPVGRQR